MCPQIETHQRKKSWYKQRSSLFISAILLAALSSWLEYQPVLLLASMVADVFMKLLKLVSIPILFFCIMTVFSSIEGTNTAQNTVRAITKYTLITTVLAATSALAFVHLFGLLKTSALARYATISEASYETSTSFSYTTWLLNAIPSNIISPFADNNAIAALLMALLLGYATSKLPHEQKCLIHSTVSAIYKLLMQTTSILIRYIPLILWAFLTILFRQLNETSSLKELLHYLLAVLGANLFQGAVVLPLLLLTKGLSPRKLFQAFSPALGMGFVTKSSSATVPLAIKCAITRAGIKESTASISFPLCTTINMNGCAAFILISVLFVGTAQGVTFTYLDQVVWIFVSTLAAVGNAGVPMGCYFLACALLASMNIPLNIMGAILPFYALIDAVETSLNLWSDSSVTAIVDQELLQKASEEGT